MESVLMSLTNMFRIDLLVEVYTTAFLQKAICGIVIDKMTTLLFKLLWSFTEMIIVALPNAKKTLSAHTVIG